MVVLPFIFLPHLTYPKKDSIVKQQNRAVGLFADLIPHTYCKDLS